MLFPDFPLMSRARVLAVCIGLAGLVLTACGTAVEQGVAPVETRPTPKPAPTLTDPSASPSPSESTPAEADFIDYRGESNPLGAQMATTAEVSKLTGAPAEFVTYMEAVITETVKANESCEEAVTTNVSVIDASGWAAGSITGCGGHRVIWRGSDEGWDESWSGQDLPSCSVLKNQKVPVRVVAGAFDEASCLEGSDVVEYSL